MSTRACPGAGAPGRHTARAFLLAPGIAALLGASALPFTVLSPSSTDMMGYPIGLEGSLVGALFMAVAFALVGYATAAVIGVPIFLVLPEKARGAFAVVVPLAGAIAAAPWVLVAAPWREGRHDFAMAFAVVAFALGVVAGVAVLFLRRPRATAEDTREAMPDRRARADAQ